jgi:Protein of unknown function (DUF2891)
MPTFLTPTLVAKFAGLALAHVTRPYPNKMDHVLNGPSDVMGPQEAHPIFYGSFDWHSCVHTYWLLTRLYREFASLSERSRIRKLVDGHFTVANVAAEVAYLKQPQRETFERPYGWAWALMLAAELSRHTTTEGRRWRVTFQPLADEFVRRFAEFLPKATYPIRAGTHFNTAFALTLALEYADDLDGELATLVRAKAIAWYGGDANCQVWEPSGDDFLSPALMEAECMRRAMEPDKFAAWLDRFLPRLAAGEPTTLFQPVTVSDRSDGKIAHLDGVNLSRAWCWRSLARAWGAGDPRTLLAHEAAERHLASSLPHLGGDYAGEHWLATYALLALKA